MNAHTKWLGSDSPERRAAFQRQLDYGNAGNVLLQTYINRLVQQIHLRELGVSSTLPVKPGSGNAAYENRRTPPVSGAEWVDDTDPGTVTQGTYGQEAFPYKTLLTKGKVTRKLQATGRSYGDILGGEMAAKTGDHGEVLESCFITGDATVNPKQFSGLLTLTQQTASQIVLATTNPVGDQLTSENLDEVIDKVKGSAQRSDLLIYASFKGRRLLNRLLQAQQEFNDVVEIAAGFRVRSYDGIPIVTTTGMPDDLVFDGTKITGFSGAVNPTTSIIVVNTRYCWKEELTPLNVMPLAKGDSQFDLFDIFWDGTLVHANTLGSALIAGISTAP